MRRIAGLCGNFVMYHFTFPPAVYEDSGFSAFFPSLVIAPFFSRSIEPFQINKQVQIEVL